MRERMASTELPGKGEFFLLHDSNYRPGHGYEGGVYLVEPQFANNLYHEGVGVLSNPKTREGTACFINVFGFPGLCVDFDNNPTFGSEDIPSRRGRGVIDALGRARVKDPLLRVTKEMLRGVIMGQVSAIKQENHEAKFLRIKNCFFEEGSDPLQIVENVFGDYDYEVYESREDFAHYSIYIRIPLASLF